MIVRVASPNAGAKRRCRDPVGGRPGGPPHAHNPQQRQDRDEGARRSPKRVRVGELAGQRRQIPRDRGRRTTRDRSSAPDGRPRTRRDRGRTRAPRTARADRAAGRRATGETARRTRPNPSPWDVRRSSRRPCRRTRTRRRSDRPARWRARCSRRGWPGTRRTCRGRPPRTPAACPAGSVAAIRPASVPARRSSGDMNGVCSFCAIAVGHAMSPTSTTVVRREPAPRLGALPEPGDAAGRQDRKGEPERQDAFGREPPRHERERHRQQR